MPPKRARVSAEYAIANIMRFMERYDNNDIVTVMMVKSVMLKIINLVPRVCPLGEILAAAGHVPRPKFSARGGCGESIKLHQHASSGILCLTVKNINFANY